MEKFIVYEFRMFAPVSIGWVTGYAQLDTGADSSLIRRSFSGSFPRVGTAKLQGALGVTQVEQCKLDRVSFLGHDFFEVVAKVQPDEAGGFQDLPFPVIGTLGVDILYQKPLYLEFAAGRVGFLEPVPLELEKCSQVIELCFEKGFAFFSLEMGSSKLRAIFDVGAGYSGLNARWLDELRPDLVEQPPEETIDPTGAKAWIPVYEHRCPKIDGYPLGETRFLILDLSEVEKALGVELDFVFGLDAMANHNWIVDKPGERLLLL